MVIIRVHRRINNLDYKIKSSTSWFGLESTIWRFSPIAWRDLRRRWRAPDGLNLALLRDSPSSCDERRETEGEGEGGWKYFIQHISDKIVWLICHLWAMSQCIVNISWNHLLTNEIIKTIKNFPLSVYQSDVWVITKVSPHKENSLLLRSVHYR